MTPPLHQAVMPAVLVAGALWIAYRQPWKRYAALLSWSFLTALFVVITWGERSYPIWIIIAAAAVLPFQIRECLICRRFRVNWATFAAFAAAAAAIAWLAGADRWNVARSYFLLEALAVQAAATAYRWRRPTTENPREKAYGYGLLVWLAVKAPTSTFVQGGIGRLLWPSVKPEQIQAACWWVLMACFVGMVAAMAWRKVPGRKRAAKKQDGRTVTGLIEMQKVA